MGKLNNGINGSFTGTIGHVVGSSINGKSYIKSKYKKRTKRISKKEKNNRSKFSVTHFWLQPLLPFVREGFKNYSQQSSGFNAAKSYVLKNAVEGVALDIAINPALVKLSHGKLPLPANITAEKSGPGKIMFTWDTVSAGASPYDQVMMAARDSKNDQASYNITGQFRRTGTDTLQVPQNRTYHIYLAFTAADRSQQSDSVYLGEMSA